MSIDPKNAPLSAIWLTASKKMLKVAIYDAFEMIPSIHVKVHWPNKRSYCPRLEKKGPTRHQLI